ncbi:unnamed protein product, partial [Ectocarpus sp. 8 AP-2014]
MPSGDEGLGAEAGEWLIDFSAGVMWARQLSALQAAEENKKRLTAAPATPATPSDRGPSSSSPPPAAPAAPAAGGRGHGGPVSAGRGGGGRWPTESSDAEDVDFAPGARSPSPSPRARTGGAPKRGNRWTRRATRPWSPAASARAGWHPGARGRDGGRGGSGADSVSPRSRCHPLNRTAHSFFTDELECPWRCKGCSQYTRSCNCSKGIAEYIRRQGERATTRFESFACRNSHCIYCKPPGLPLYMAEWAVSSARFKLKGGQPPPTLGRIQKQAVPPRWEREAIPDGRASAASGVSARDEEARSVSGGGRSGGANEPPRVRSTEGAVEGFHRRLGANERCNQCTGCLLPNCGKCWGCQHRVEYGGSGQRNQPCVDRWCRTKAAQRESDKLDKAARRKRAMAVGGSGVGTKRPLESSGEDYEGDYGGGDVFADKRFRRRTPKGTAAAAAAAAAAGRTSPTPTGTAVSGGDYSGLSYVFAGEGKGDGGGGLPRPNHEAAHVSAESAGIVLSAVGGGVGGASSSSGSSSSNNSRARPSSRSRRSGLKDLLGKGYRCLALLEELGARPLL